MMTNNIDTNRSQYGRPKNMDLQIKIQQEREFMIAKALNSGRGSEIFAINNLPDDHFKRLIEAREK